MDNYLWRKPNQTICIHFCNIFETLLLPMNMLINKKKLNYGTNGNGKEPVISLKRYRLLSHRNVTTLKPNVEGILIYINLGYFKDKTTYSFWELPFGSIVKIAYTELD